MKDLDDTAEDVGQGPDQTVWRRRVYFISGFDPNGPRRCYFLYRDEAKAQAEISGYRIKTSRMTYEKGAPVVSWTAEMQEDGRKSEAQIHMLRWDDIARTWMRRSLPSTYLLMVRTLWFYLTTGAYGALSRISALSTSLGLYPVAMMILYAAGAAGSGYLVYLLGAALGLPQVGAGLGVGVAYVLMRLTRRIDEATFVYYLLYDFAFTAAHSRGLAPEIDVRINAFADRIAADWQAGEVDEVLIIGHSSGSAHAAAVAARLVEAGIGGNDGPKLSLLTLGQNIPMLSFLPGATQMRDDLRTLGQSDQVEWIDISTPADAVSYSLTDPVSASGIVLHGEARKNPRVYSAKFWSAISAEMEAKLRRRYFRIHLQYLCAFDQPQDYDYFRITVGGLRLGQHFEGRRETPNLKRGPFIQKRLRQ